MNKADLISKVAQTTDISKKDIEAVVNGFIEIVTETLSNKEKVQLVGFGTFETHKRAERNGRNPKTGESLVIPASTSVGFKAGKQLKDAVKG